MNILYLSFDRRSVNSVVLPDVLFSPLSPLSDTQVIEYSRIATASPPVGSSHFNSIEYVFGSAVKDEGNVMPETNKVQALIFTLRL